LIYVSQCVVDVLRLRLLVDDDTVHAMRHVNWAMMQLCRSRPRCGWFDRKAGDHLVGAVLGYSGLLYQTLHQSNMLDDGYRCLQV
jgi:hypothetical protein